MKRDILWIVFYILGGVVLIFILSPILSIILSSSPKVLWETIREQEVYKAIWLTLYASLISTAVAFLFGIPLAYLLARKGFFGKGFIEGIIDIPIVIPHIGAGVALLTTFSQDTLFGKIFSLIGIRFVGEVPGIILAMMFVSIPFLIDSAKEGFLKVGERLEKVSRTLGASPFQTFWKISLPLAKRDILSGLVLMWSRGISEFGAVVILTYHPKTCPVLIWQRFESFGISSARPVSALLIIICLLVFTILRIRIKRWGLR
ncbi:MAG: ABC transporter permease [bacterium]|nr:ABC transporter permease [bacterium]